MSGQIDLLEGLRRAASAWWLLLLVGLLCIAAGVIVLAEPGISLATLAVVAGIFLLVDGVFEIMASLSKTTEHRGLLALLGVLSVLVGIVLVRDPIRGVVAIALLLGIWLVGFGLVRFITVFAEREHRGWNVLVAIVEVIAGTVIVSAPGIGVATLALFVGIAFILRGIAISALAWAIHALKHDVSGRTPHAPAAA
jgi:uncharacterized membrane protein HdeD (DUF308 family)